MEPPRLHEMTSLHMDNAGHARDCGDYATCCLEIAGRVSVLELIPLDICLGFGLPFFVDFVDFDEDGC